MTNGKRIVEMSLASKINVFLSLFTISMNSQSFSSMELMYFIFNAWFSKISTTAIYTFEPKRANTDFPASTSELRPVDLLTGFTGLTGLAGTPLRLTGFSTL